MPCAPTVDMKSLPKRKSIRKPGYDYTRAGAYFVTICTYQRQHLFGRVIDDAVMLSELGQVVATEWQKTPTIRAEVALDEWVIMPNHFHALLWLSTVAGEESTGPPLDEQGTGSRAPLRRESRSLGSCVAGFKAAVTRQINLLRNTPGMSVWQRNYYDHIVRNEMALNAIRAYIRDNPRRWSQDRYNPDAVGPDPRAADIWRMLQNPTDP